MYNILSYTYMQLLVLIPYLIFQCTFMDHLKLLKIHFNIVLQSTHRPFKWSLSLRFPHRNPVRTPSVPHTSYMPSPSHSFWFDHWNNIWCGVESTKLLVICLLYSPLASSLLGPNIIFSSLFSDSLSVCSFLGLKDKVSHPYKQLCPICI